MINRFSKNTVWLVGGQIIKMLISFVVGTLTARYLGPSNYGTINYVNSYLTFFTSIVGLGMNGVIIYELGNHHDEEGKILGTAIVMRFFMGVISSIAMTGVVAIFNDEDSLIIDIAILLAIQLPFLAFDTFNYWYQSNFSSKYAVIVQTIAYICTSAYKIFILVTGKSVQWFAFASSLDIVLLAILYYITFYKKNHPKLAVSFLVGKRMLKKCGPFILANMMVFVYGQMDRIMLKHMLGSTGAVGLYSSAITITSLISLIPTALLDSGRPVIVDAKAHNEDLYQIRIRQLFAGIIWICFAYSICVTFFSKFVIWLLYGEAYLEANSCLKIAVWYTAFSYVGSGKSLWLICEKKEKYVFLLSAMGAGTNLLLNSLMIPKLGINGAAMATLITQVFTNVVYPSFFSDTRGYSVCVLEAIVLKNVNIKEIRELIKMKNMR